MRNALTITFLTLAVALTSFADESAGDRHQSFLSYDDGGTVVRSGEDGREIEAHRNLPIYPGDEVVTARRGRAEVRLSDGNIIGIDRTTSVLFRSMLDAYDGENEETVVELRYGKVAVQRTDLGRDHVRLDTERASYVAEYESIYSVETDSRGRDRVIVFDGSVEIRTPERTTRLRSGETVTVDDDGVYDLVGDQRASADDFERWFLNRAERLQKFDTRHVDRRLGYWADDLDEHGRWVHVAGFGWTWRPYVNAGWRPYYNGYWHHRGGSLTWVSYDPWAWGTYHYGRWAFDPLHGWIWVPGYAYSPAWVYWMYGSGYTGWAPAGWWDCYRPYSTWAYSPYSRYHGFGFYGRVRINELDLRPWTFVDSGTLISNRIDRAALTTDAVKQRLGRSRDGFATIGGGSARLTREEWNDPANAIRRRGLYGNNTGAETGAAATDMTPFVRRDTNIPSDVRERVIRARGPEVPAGGTTGRSRAAGGGLAPIGRGSVAPVGRGSVAPIDGADNGAVSRQPAAPAPAASTPSRRGDDGGRIDRGSTSPRATEPRTVEPRTPPPSTEQGGTRRRSIGGGSTNRRDNNLTATTPGQVQAPAAQPDRDTWRSRVRSDDSKGDAASTRRSTGGSKSDVPTRVIDRIGGARIRPRSTPSADAPKASAPSTTTRERSATRSRSNDGGSRSTVRDRGSDRSSGGSSARSSGGSSSGGGSSARSGGGSSSGGDRSSGGRIKRD